MGHFGPVHFPTVPRPLPTVAIPTLNLNRFRGDSGGKFVGALRFQIAAIEILRHGHLKAKSGNLNLFLHILPFFPCKIQGNKGKKGKMRRKWFRLPDFAFLRSGRAQMQATCVMSLSKGASAGENNFTGKTPLQHFRELLEKFGKTLSP